MSENHHAKLNTFFFKHRSYTSKRNMILFLLGALGCLIHAAPSTGPSSFCPIEDLPWTISNIVVFTSNITSTNAAKSSSGMGMTMANDTVYSDESFIDFYFCDSNEGLELEVECTRSTNGSLMDDENFYPCDQRGVVFKYGGHSLEVQRAYKSPW